MLIQILIELLHYCIAVGNSGGTGTSQAVISGKDFFGTLFNF